ncbi:site-2 protease family protein [uncultured Winogradskyella sp.]|uniref:site-2 protease family protein n=1 Tax=uncultured Winogradskyella sp. TaxID=395353 RepID=UPI002610D70F|nr:site-2 protease family protein [uncultured Winogradskyella sp.]
MKANLSLGRVSGIKIKVHWTFFLLIVWIIVDELKHGGSTESILFNIAFVFAVFLCVVLHELGHALTAKKIGVKTEKITLLPIGGMASFDKMPESPKQEFLIVIAGPLVNLAIAILLYFVIPVKELFNQSFTDAYGIFASFSFQNFLFFLFIVNVALALFNMIPAFPMDGGRLLRALLALKMNRAKATQIAASLGQFIAIIFLLIGLLYNPILIFIALFIFLGAYAENQTVQHLELLKNHTVEEAMLLDITTFKPKDSIDLVVNKLISGTEINFAVVENGIIKGVLRHEKIIENSNKNILVEAVMDTNFETVKETDNLKKIHQLIYSKKQIYLPVVNQGKILGAIDAINLNEYIALQSKLAY